jgi:ceramide glucosyltransferase
VIQVLRDCIGFACLAAAVLGCAYALGAAALMPRLRGRAFSACAASPGVTVLKPLRGAEPALHDNLESFCEQDYAGPVQLLFGVEQSTDDAVAVVRRLRSSPGRDVELVPCPEARGPNPKVATLAALEPHIRHPVVVVADSDIAVPRDYLARIVAALDGKDVGLVTCLYRGQARDGFWALLAGMAIDYHFLPGVLIGVKLGLARPCFGSTVALRRETLSVIGGFARFVHHLADDHAIGEAVRAAGMRVAIPPFVVEHGCAERSFSDLVRHEMRWARTIRAVTPLGYLGSALTHPLPFALLAIVFLGVHGITAAVAAAAPLCRLVLELRVDDALGVRATRWAVGPVRDLLSFAIFVAAFFVGAVTWRGRRYRVRPDGTLASMGESRT